MPLTEDIVLDARPEILQWYVEQNVNLWFYAAHLGPILASRPAGRMLDVGCCFGFALDFARRLFHWQVQGVEPSVYGQWGARELGLPILDGLLTEQDPFDGQRFDLILASQVIEHVPDPRTFLRLLRRYLAPGGIIALTTPCADAIDAPGLDPLMRDALLSPGAHTVLFNRAAFSRLLAANRFTHHQAAAAHNQITAYASDAPLGLADIDPADLTRRYLRQAAATMPEGLPRRAMRARLYRLLIESASYDEAAAIWPAIALPPCRDDLDAIVSFEDFLRRYPANAAALAYFRGLHWLNGGTGDPASDGAAAAAMFAQAQALCRCRLRMPVYDHTEEASLLWPARFHEAFAWLVAGAPAKAAAIARPMTESDDPTLDPVLRDRAQAILADAIKSQSARGVRQRMLRGLRRLLPAG